MNTATIHYFSQLVYLNLPPGLRPEDSPTVEAVVYYYRSVPLGRQLLEKRFGAIPAELEQWKQMLDQTPAELGAYRIVDILNDNAPDQSGFYGCAYQSPGGERVVAFRGSEMLGNPRFRNDYETDFSLIYCRPTRQQTMVDAYWSRFGGGGEKLWVTGHSLGGNLAAYGAMAAPSSVRSRIVRCLSFNGPGFCPEFIDRYRAALAELGDRLVLYQNRGDIVSSLLESPVVPFLADTTFEPAELENPTVSDYLYPHSNFVFATDDKGELLPAPHGKKSGLCQAVHTLSQLLLLLPLQNREELVNLALELIYGTEDPIDGKHKALTAMGSYLVKNLSGHLGAGDLAKAAYAAAMLLGKEKTGALLKSMEEEKPVLSRLAEALLFLLDLPKRA